MGRASAKKLKAVEAAPALKLDFGCGPHKRDGFTGVDVYAFAGVDFICDLTQAPWTMHGNVPSGLQAIPGGDVYMRSGALRDDDIAGKGVFTLTDSSVTEAHASHFVEHLTAEQRFTFFNELYRVLSPNGTCQIIVPHWASCRAYGDLTHQWPPMGEFFWYYLSRDWRAGNAPHTDAQYRQNGLNCHFEATWGYSLRQDLTVRHPEFQQDAIANHKEAIMDMIATVKALK